MKKWLFLLLVLLLVGCTDKENKETDVKENAQEEKVQKEINENNENIAKVLKEIRDTYGFIGDKKGFYDNEEWDIGFIHGQIFDFNNDNSKELAVLFKPSDFHETSLSHRKTNDYVFELWGNRDNTYQLLYYKTIPKDSCSACDLSIGLMEYKEGNYGIVLSSNHMIEGHNYTTEEHHFMTTPGNLDTMVFDSVTGFEQPIFKIDDEEVESEFFETKHEQYNGDLQYWIESGAGEKEFAINRDSSGQTFQNLMKEIQPDEEIDGKSVDSSGLNKPAQRILDITDIDIHDPKSMQSMVEQVVLFEGLDTFKNVEGYFGTLSTEEVGEVFEKLYGVPLDLTNAELEPFRENNSAIVSYKDSKFYVPATDLQYLRVMRTIEKAWEISDQTYYLVLNDTIFDEQQYYFETNGDEGKINQLLKQPVKNWPEDARKLAKSNIRKYMVIHLNGDDVVVRYLKYDPLTNEQLKKYQ